MRTFAFAVGGAAIFVAASVLGAPHRHPPGPPVVALPVMAQQEDPQVFVSGTRRPALAIALLPWIGAKDLNTAIIDTIVRDFGLTSLVRLSDPATYADIPLGPAPSLALETSRWTARGVEAIVRGVSSVLADGRVRIELQFYAIPRERPPTNLTPTMTRVVEAWREDLVPAVHKLGNDMLRSLTGVSGNFGSKLVFSTTIGQNQKGIYEIDSDGQKLVRLPAVSNVAMAPTFGPRTNGGQDVFYAAKTGADDYSLFRIGHPAPVLVNAGKVFGAAFDRTRMALVVGQSGQSDIFVGNADGTALRQLTSGGLNIHPSWGPNGELAYVSTRSGNPQVYVDGRRVSTRGVFNMAPTWCKDPEGTKVVFMGRDGTPWDIFSVEAAGGPQSMKRLTESSGSNTYPACSPDGRQIAFFSTRAAAGPGLYVMSTRGQNPKKISSVMGESLRWEGE